MWRKGIVCGYTWEAKVFKLASEFGIGSGNVSKLEIQKNNKVIFNYDRGLDFSMCSARVLLTVLEDIKNSK